MYIYIYIHIYIYTYILPSKRCIYTPVYMHTTYVLGKRPSISITTIITIIDIFIIIIIIVNEISLLLLASKLLLTSPKLR